MAQVEMFAAKANSPATELTAAITDVATTVSVLDASKLPDAPNIATIGVDESAETVRYEGKSGNDLTGVTRGFSGTVAKAWGVGVGVARYFTAYDADALRENVVGHSAQLADNAVSPDIFPGTDQEKVQAAVDFAIANQKAIKLARMYDVSSAGPIYIDKPDDRWTLQFFGVGGGFTKNDAGYLFTTNFVSVGDISFSSVNFESTEGAAVKLFNASKIIRLFSTDCNYKNVDCIIDTPDSYVQSYRFKGGIIVGGHGNAIQTPGAFDMVFTSVLVEHREHFFKQLKDTASAYPSLYNVTFRDVCVEGLTGRAYSICNVNLLTIDGGYYEKNGGGDIYFDPSGTYVTVSISNIRSQQNTGNPSSLCIIKWGGTVQEAKVFNVVGVEVVVNDTTSISTGYVTLENVRVQGAGIVKNIDPNSRLIKYSSGTDYTDISGVSTSNLGMFRRLKRSYTASLNANAQNIVIVTFPEAIRTDDFISIQMIRPMVLSQEIILSSYNKNGSTVEIWIKNNYSSTVSVTLDVVILKPFYSVTG